MLFRTEWVASHNIVAFRLSAASIAAGGGARVLEQDCDDDGESAAGGRLLKLMVITGAANVCVVVTRWFGGVHLGPDRASDSDRAI